MEATLSTDFVSILRQRAQTDPDRLAFTFLEGDLDVTGTLTYGQLHQRAAALAGQLRQTLSPGERALLLYPAGLDYVVAFYACLYARVIAVPSYLPQRRTVDTLNAVAADCSASLVLTTPSGATRRSLFTADSPLGSVPWQVADAEPDADPSLVAQPDGEVTPDTVAYLQYTSGSTSTPKGVVITHHNAVRQCDEAGRSWRFDASGRWVSWLPHFHDYGQISAIMLPVFAGAQSVLMAPATFVSRPARWLRAITVYRATHTGAPNFAYDLCTAAVDDAAGSGLDLSSLELAGDGAEPVHAGTLEGFQRAFAPHGLRPGVLSPAYGLAEATLKVTSSAPGEPFRTGHWDAATVGAPVTPSSDERSRPLVACGTFDGDTEVAVVDPKAAHRLPDGHVGEVWVRGPIVSPGYWQRPEENERTFRARIAGEDGGPHLRTGDLGFLLDGQLYICGRIKDVVIVGGHNHYPHDIERTTEESHPAVRPGHTAAFGVPDGPGEALVVVAERVRHHASPPAEVAEVIRDAVWRTHDLVPTVVIADAAAVPVTTSGKIQRRRCRTEFLQDRLPVLARLDPAPAPARPVASAPPARPAAASAADVLRHSCLEQITGWIGEQLPAGTSVDTQQPFSRYGMTSMQLMELHALLEDWGGVPLPPDLMWDSESVDDLAGQVAARLVPAAMNGVSR